MPTPEREPRSPRPTVSMTALLAANAAANAVSTPPRPQPTKKKAGPAAKSGPSGA